MTLRIQRYSGEQWSYPRFLVGCIASFTNYVGGWYFPLNMLVCLVSSALIGIVAHTMGGDIIQGDNTVQGKLLVAGAVIISWIIGLFCLWFILWLIVGRIEFPKCKGGCCCGRNDYSYRFGTWLGLIGWRKWVFGCSCGHLYVVHRGKWRLAGTMKLESEQEESHGRSVGKECQAPVIECR